jgi:flagellar basal-body rod modification protein FlgD
MRLDAINGANTGAGLTGSTTQSSSIGKDTFLKLLVAQMTHQDPLNPQDQQAFLAQLAQFSTVEGVNNVQESQTRLQATNMLGKKVDALYMENNSAQAVSGVVTNVRFERGGVTLNLQGLDRPVKLTEVTNVHQ